MNNWDLWKLITADLQRARNTLPATDATDRAITDYHEYLDNNELDLACDMLEAYADEHEVTREFWVALASAAEKMKLSVKLNRYRNQAEKG